MKIEIKWKPVNQFRRKTYGRIFLRVPEEEVIVREVMKEIDEYELDYMPEDIFQVWMEDEEENELVYLHKFEMDMNALTQKCLNRGVWIWCVDGGRYP